MKKSIISAILAFALAATCFAGSAKSKGETKGEAKNYTYYVNVYLDETPTETIESDINAWVNEALAETIEMTRLTAVDDPDDIPDLENQKVIAPDISWSYKNGLSKLDIVFYDYNLLVQKKSKKVKIGTYTASSNMGDVEESFGYCLEKVLAAILNGFADLEEDAE